MDTADVIVRIADITQNPRLEASEREILALNKVDLLDPRTAAKQLPQSGPVAISCRTGEGIERLVDLIVTKARGDRPLMLRCWPQSTRGIRRAFNVPNPACARLQKNSGPALTRNLSPCLCERPSTLSARSSARRMLKRFWRDFFHFLHRKVNIYTRILRPLLFSLDAERAHHLICDSSRSYRRFSCA